jgi:hypothetical protein
VGCCAASIPAAAELALWWQSKEGRFTACRATSSSQRLCEAWIGDMAWILDFSGQ